jgi:uncharacterized membrane protein YhaH (DUF805 family)
MSDATESISTHPPARRSFEWRHAFVSLEGRLSRRSFWLAALIAALLSFAVYFLLAASLGLRTPGRRNEAIAIASLVEFAVMLYPRVAVEVKRLHDFDWSGWWALPMNLLQLAAVLVYAAAQHGNDDESTVVGLGVSILVLLSIVLGTPRGDARENRFGLPTG